MGVPVGRVVRQVVSEHARGERNLQGGGTVEGDGGGTWRRRAGNGSRLRPPSRREETGP